MIEDAKRTRMLLFFDEIESEKLVSKVGSVCKEEKGSKYRKITTFEKGSGFKIVLFFQFRFKTKSNLRKIRFYLFEIFPIGINCRIVIEKLCCN